MNIVFRADASLRLGHGHVVRCLTLANELREHAQIRFVCREEEGHLCDRIQQHGFEVHRLAAGDRSMAEDAEETRAAISAAEAPADWLIVDHYRLDLHWEAALRDSAQRVMVIDDLADRMHDCDVLLDQNLVDGMALRYRDKIPAACTLLLGPEYALLQPIYAELRKRVAPRRGPVKRILIFWGGTDSDDFAGRTLAAIIALGQPDIRVDVVVTASYQHADRVRRLAAAHANIRVCSDLPTLAPLMAQADLAVGGTGTTSWERLCLGVPTLAVSMADNQRPVAEALHAHGLIELLGHKDEVTESVLIQALERVISQGLQAHWSERCMAAVDGRGTKRVVAALLSTKPQLVARAAQQRDEDMLLEWANDPVTRRNAFHPETISADEHHAWFHACLSDPECCRLFIVQMNDGVPIGQVRFDRVGATWEISYALAPVFRGRGLGRPLLETALRKLQEREPGAIIIGRVKQFNRPSCRVFEALGFEQRVVDEDMEYRRAL